MIKTTQPVSFDPIDLTRQAVVFAEITQSIRNDKSETYTISIREWIEIPYTETVEMDGEMVEQEFTRQQTVRTHSRTMTFADVDQLTAFLDDNFDIQEQGSSRRKIYTILGHLIVNNQENVRNVQWELVSV
jgi:hypothetical protein